MCVLPVSSLTGSHLPGKQMHMCAARVLFLHSEPLLPKLAQHSKTLEEKESAKESQHTGHASGSGRTLPSAALGAPRLGQEVLQQGPVAARRGVGQCFALCVPLQGRGRH